MTRGHSSEHLELFRTQIGGKKLTRLTAAPPDLQVKQDKLAQLQTLFPSPWRYEGQPAENPLAQALTLAVEQINQLRPLVHSPEATKPFLGKPDHPDYTQCWKAEVPKTIGNVKDVIQKLSHYYDGMLNFGHPYTMINVNGPTNMAAIAGGMMSELINPNILEGDLSWNVAKTELETAAMMAKLVGWDPKRAGGVFTFGGSGCYLYGTKLALSKVLRGSRENGVRVDAQILVSAEAHYTKVTVSDWTGLGTKNLRLVPVDKQNRMDIGELRKMLRQCQEEGKPVAMVVCTAGTTDAFGVDDIQAVWHAIHQENFHNPHGYPAPLLYVDAVIGWSWKFFDNYDLEQNPLEFKPEALEIIRHNVKSLKHLDLADAIGCDFHKTGWSPYNCSIFLVKDYAQCQELLARPIPPYLIPETEYNPMLFTLECTRGGFYSTMAWATLNALGVEGFQVILGRVAEVQAHLREHLEAEDTLVCVNPDDTGFVTLFRVYPAEFLREHKRTAKEQYELELTDEAYRADVLKHNAFNNAVFDVVFAKLRSPDERHDENTTYPPYISYTGAFRPATYPGYLTPAPWFGALKSFPMSPFCLEEAMDQLVRHVKAAAAEVEGRTREHALLTR